MGGATFPLVEQSVDFVDLPLESLQLRVVGFALLVKKIENMIALIVARLGA